MRSVVVALSVALLAACSHGCVGTSDHPIPDPSTRPLPPQPANGCEQEAATAKRLGCPWASDDYAANCTQLDQHLAAQSQAPADHACAIAATTCDQMKGCQ